MNVYSFLNFNLTFRILINVWAWLINQIHWCMKSLREKYVFLCIFRRFFVHRRHQYSDCWVLCIKLSKQVTEDWMNMIKKEKILKRVSRDWGTLYRRNLIIGESNWMFVDVCVCMCVCVNECVCVWELRLSFRLE